MTLFSVLLVSTFSSDEVLNFDSSHATMTTESTEFLKGDKPIEQQQIGINLEPKQDSINASVGKNGNLDLGNFEDIKLEGVYTEIKDNPYIELTENGVWKAIKPGNTKITIGVALSESTLEAIKTKYPDCEIIYPAKALKVLEVKVNDNAGEIYLDYHVSPGSIQAVVGGAGEFTIGNFEDIPLTGTFEEVKDNPFIEIQSDGKWKALKAGETQVLPNFIISDESLSKIEAKYPGKPIVKPAMQQLIPVKITDAKVETVTLTYHFSPGSIETEVNSVGMISVGDFEGIPLAGTFKEVKDNPYVELKSDGSWKALKAGETQILPTFTLSEETIAKINARYPGKEIIVPEIQQVIPFKIKEKSVVDSNKSGENQTIGTSKPVDRTETLPKTGETESYILKLIGISTIFIMIRIKRRVRVK
ncbi:hypothetical protein RV18_GL000694 [Enterococcus termitis]|nr:hypothetical protein RV18_GL000694 [Enterococcus termitis]